jgi:putative transposase
MVGPKAKRRALEAIRGKYELSVRQSCQILGLRQSTFYYKPKKIRDDSQLKAQILNVLEKKPGHGRPWLTWRLRERMGVKDNHKRIGRIYRELGLQMYKRKKSRRLTRPKMLLEVPSRPNQRWAMDFVLDSFASGRRFRILTLKDLFTHEALCLHVDTSITGERVAEVLEQLKVQRRLPKAIISDNGSEFVSKAMDQWAYKNNVELKFIQPGKPTQNAFIESFNGKFRAECLNQHWFENLAQARQIIEDWRVEYNTERPNKPLGKKTPAEFAKEQGLLLYG